MLGREEPNPARRFFCRMAASQLEADLVERDMEIARLNGKIAELQVLLEEEKREAEELRHSKRQQGSADAAASAAAAQTTVVELGEKLAKCQAELRSCRAELAKSQEEARRRSSGGSHPAEQPVQEQPGQQVQEQQVQAAGLPVWGAAEAAAAVAEAPAAIALAPGEAGLTRLSSFACCPPGLLLCLARLLVHA